MSCFQDEMWDSMQKNGVEVEANAPDSGWLHMSSMLCPGWIRARPCKPREIRALRSERTSHMAETGDNSVTLITKEREQSKNWLVPATSKQFRAKAFRPRAVISIDEGSRGLKSAAGEWIRADDWLPRSLRRSLISKRGAHCMLCAVLSFSLVAGGWCKASRDMGWESRPTHKRSSFALDEQVEDVDDYFRGSHELGKRTSSEAYPAVLDRASANVQTVDDLVYNHFIVHSHGGGGWWWGGRSRSSFAEVGGEDPVCSLHHKEIRASRRDHNVTRTESCARSHGGMLWQGRYLFADKVVVAEDGSTALRAAKDYQSQPLPGALVLVKFFRERRLFDSELSLLSWIEQEQPGLVARALATFELEHDHIIDQDRRFLIVLEGGSPLSDVVALNDNGDGISRELAVSILSQTARSLSKLSQIGLELTELSSNMLMVQDDGSVKIFDVSTMVTVKGRAGPCAAVEKALFETPLCLPEKSFGIGDSGAVWAYRNVAYLMMPRPGHAMFSCGRSTDASVQRASITLQTTRLYLLQIRVQSGPAWLPDPSSTSFGP